MLFAPPCIACTGILLLQNDAEKYLFKLSRDKIHHVFRLSTGYDYERYDNSGFIQRNMFYSVQMDWHFARAGAVNSILNLCFYNDNLLCFILTIFFHNTVIKPRPFNSNVGLTA